MRAQHIASLLACLLATTVYATDATTNDTGGLILEELRSIRSSLDRIADELSELRTVDERRKAVQSLSVDYPAFTRQGPDIATLADLTLPDDPSPKEVKQYILDIVSASQGQNTFSDRDPQVALLTRVGRENLPLLIEALSYARSMNDYHIKRAIVNLADESNKSLILDSLPIHQDLVTAVIQHGWEEDARDILLTELKNTGQYLPTEWIQAAASLNDPESYPLLRDYFINGQNRSWTYKAIKHLPIEDMPGAVAEAWQRSKYGDDCNRIYMAIIAVKYGHLDALAVLVDSLTSGTPDSYWSSQEARPAVLRHTGFRGSNSELGRWFEANRDQLRFDAESCKFIMATDVEQPDGEPTQESARSAAP